MNIKLNDRSKLIGAGITLLVIIGSFSVVNQPKEDATAAQTVLEQKINSQNNRLITRFKQLKKQTEYQLEYLKRREVLDQNHGLIYDELYRMNIELRMSLEELEDLHWQRWTVKRRVYKNLAKDTEKQLSVYEDQIEESYSQN